MLHLKLFLTINLHELLVFLLAEADDLNAHDDLALAEAVREELLDRQLRFVAIEFV